MKKRTFFLLFLITIIIIGAAFSWYWLNPSRVVNKAFEKISQSDTQSFSGTAMMYNTEAIQRLIGEPGSIEVAVAGFYERQSTDWDSVSADVRITIATESVTARVEGEIIFIGDEAYVKITKSPGAFPALVELKDIWISLPRGGDKTKSQFNSDEVFFTKVERIDKKDIGDKKITSYQAEADQATMIYMLDGISGILGTHLSTKEIDELRNEIKSVETTTVELSVEPWTRKLRYFAAIILAPNNNEVAVALTLQDQEELVSIITPPGAVTLESILTASIEQNRSNQ